MLSYSYKFRANMIQTWMTEDTMVPKIITEYEIIFIQ